MEKFNFKPVEKDGQLNINFEEKKQEQKPPILDIEKDDPTYDLYGRYTEKAINERLAKINNSNSKLLKPINKNIHKIDPKKHKIQTKGEYWDENWFG